jgi:XTP/dITP diphosphohydrolase
VRLDTLVIATTNSGKVREIRLALDGVPTRLLALTDFPAAREPEETGATFAENARLKAAYYSAHTGMPTVADDSGLAVDALAGRPGVASARYPGATYVEKFENLYRELDGHARPWTARCVCSVAVVDAQGQRLETQTARPAEPHVLFTAEAAVEGEIARQPKGSNGFGYDPIFFYPPFDRTLGEASDQEKLSVSHRGQAFRQLREWLMATTRA